ncbi:MAG TPA: hypothetical protein VFZ65_10940 [Planctomycetota bacterium]|nr:hypothetical protein [Planctomycetota bacterium]
MTSPGPQLDWLRAFLPLGGMEGDSWRPIGGGFLLLERPVAWLVTARSVLDGLEGRHLVTWVASQKGAGLLDVTDSQRQLGIDWIHHPTGLSATLFPIHESFSIKAFTETQCTRLRDLQPLQPSASVGCPYGADINAPHLSPAVHDGVISFVDARSGFLYSTAPLLPRNAGAPLLLASPYGGAVTLAGILLGNTMLGETDPRVLPVRLSRAICVDAVLELIRGEAAADQRHRATEKREANAEPGKERL